MNGVRSEDFRQDYNRCRPHRAHAMMTPEAFKADWETTREAPTAGAELRSAYGLPPFDAGDTLTLQVPTTHQLSLGVDR